MSTRELQSYLSFEVHALDKSAASYQASQPISTTEGSQIDGKDGQIKVIRKIYHYRTFLSYNKYTFYLDFFGLVWNCTTPK